MPKSYAPREEAEKRICYRPLRGYKYQLLEDYSAKAPFKPPEEGVGIDGFISFDLNGDLLIKAGYAWDGASGPAIDTDNFLRPSLVHDAFYQLMREGDLPWDYRDKVDRLLQQMCIEDGMSKTRAWWVYWGVRLGYPITKVFAPQPA